jgi:LysR family hydrogen peroxide-inducible transcriptional activator
MAAGDRLPRELPINLHFQHLNYLRAVDAAESLAEAARELNVSQPALSQALDEIERRLGLALFERGRRRRRLNQDGRMAAEFARELLGRAGAFASEMGRRREGAGGTLRVGTIDAGSLYILPEALRRFRRAAPGVDLRLHVANSAELEAKVLHHELDLAFVIDDGREDPGLVREPLLREALYLYGPGGRARPDEDDDWVLYPTRSHTREEIDRELARRGWSPRVRLESSNPQVLRQMVALGFGWSVLPRAVAEIGPEPLRPADPSALAKRGIVILQREVDREDSRAHRFLELARGWARSQQAL